jgi:hypothetical protein
MDVASDVERTTKAQDALIAELARAQHGVFTLQQAKAAGIDPSLIARRLATGVLIRAGLGVYRVAAVRSTFRQQLLTACYAWGEGAFASHRSAGYVRGLVGVRQPMVELTVPYNRKRKAPGTIHRSSLQDIDVEVVDAIPVTTVERTLIDLAGILPLDVVEPAVHDALYRRATSLPRLRWRNDQLAAKGRGGIIKMRSILDLLNGLGSVPQSKLESLLLRIIVDAGLPRPETQYRVHDGTKLLPAVDFAYPDVRLALESDGRRFHSGPADFENDRLRDAALAALGWRVVRFTWQRVTQDKAGVVATIKAALGDTLPG